MLTKEELEELKEEVQDAMAFRLKEEWDFEVDESTITIAEMEDSLKVDVTFKGRFDGSAQTLLVVAAALKEEPYYKVAITQANIRQIDIDNLKVTSKTTEETEKIVWGWNGANYYILADEEEDKEEKEKVKKLVEKYKSLLEFRLETWTENIRKEYIMEVNKRYWTQRLDAWCEDCKNGKQFI